MSNSPPRLPEKWPAMRLYQKHFVDWPAIVQAYEKGVEEGLIDPKELSLGPKKHIMTCTHPMSWRQLFKFLELNEIEKYRIFSLISDYLKTMPYGEKILPLIRQQILYRPNQNLQFV